MSDLLDIARRHFDAEGLKAVDVPEWGVAVYFKPETPSEAADIASRFGVSGVKATIAAVMMRARREDGSAYFEDRGYQTLNALMTGADFEVIERVHAAMTRTSLVETLAVAKILSDGIDRVALAELSAALRDPEKAGELGELEGVGVLGSAIAGLERLAKSFPEAVAAKKL